MERLIVAFKEHVNMILKKDPAINVIWDVHEDRALPLIRRVNYNVVLKDGSKETPDVLHL